METYTNKIYNKVIRVIESCKTEEQLITASKYACNFLKIYRDEVNSIEYIHLKEMIETSELVKNKNVLCELLLNLRIAWKDKI